MRMQVVVDFKYPPKPKKQSFDKMMDQLLDLSIGIFVEEVASRLPWWTGQARGTFIPVLKKAHLTLSLLTSPTKNPYRPASIRADKNMSTGAKYGKALKNHSGGVYSFTYASTLDYMDENEFIDQPRTARQQRRRAWHILQETAPIIQSRINKAAMELIKQEFSNVYVAVRD